MRERKKVDDKQRKKDAMCLQALRRPLCSRFEEEEKVDLYMLLFQNVCPFAHSYLI